MDSKSIKAANDLFQAIRWLALNNQEVKLFRWQGEQPIVEITPGNPEWEQGEKDGYFFMDYQGCKIVWKKE